MEHRSARRQGAKIPVSVENDSYSENAMDEPSVAELRRALSGRNYSCTEYSVECMLLPAVGRGN
jgi:hypothetical protein